MSTDQDSHMTQLAVPLKPCQLEAAARLQLQLRQWQLADTALRLLADRFPGFAREATLLKVVAVSGLYATNVYAQARIAEHVYQTLKGKDLTCGDAGLVEDISRLPETDGQKKPRKHVSFASKFAHFYIDANRFPILDRYAVQMLRYHLSKPDYDSDQQHSYVAFVANTRRLIDTSGIECNVRELDVYLWLAGVYQEWRKKPDRVNREAAAMFANPSVEVADDLRLMIGQ
jgi:hypothetical protein